MAHTPNERKEKEKKEPPWIKYRTHSCQLRKKKKKKKFNRSRQRARSNSKSNAITTTARLEM